MPSPETKLKAEMFKLAQESYKRGAVNALESLKVGMVHVSTTAPEISVDDVITIINKTLEAVKNETV